MFKQKDGLIRKIKLRSKSWKQAIAIHILPNISRSKGNQTTKTVQLIDSIRENFLENHPQNVVEKLLPDPFLKDRN